MSGPQFNHGHRKMHRAVRRRARRRDSREDERSIWQNLSMIGALGWLIVTPILLGILAGRWLASRDYGIINAEIEEPP